MHDAVSAFYIVLCCNVLLLLLWVFLDMLIF